MSATVYVHAPFGPQDSHKPLVISDLRTQGYNVFFTNSQTVKSRTLTFREPATRIAGYIPVIGTIVGLVRIVLGFIEHSYFHGKNPTSELSNDAWKNTVKKVRPNTILWQVRGFIELFPVVGGIILMLTDLFVGMYGRRVEEKKRSQCGSNKL